MTTRPKGTLNLWSSPEAGFKGYLGYSYAKAGRKESALAILNELTIRSKTENVPSFQVRPVATRLREVGGRLSGLRSIEEGGRPRFPHTSGVCLVPLRGYPRFQEIVRRLNFPEHLKSKHHAWSNNLSS